MADEVDPAEVAASLRVVLAAVDRGEVEATALEAAYLAGAVDALGRISVSAPLGRHEQDDDGSDEPHRYE